ncbi:MAG: three-Cys-motif partner protein TcmP [Promethearchaeota archaeon]
MSDNYFEEKMLNTELKHKILKNILTKSISIASVARIRETNDKYTFADFYAGEGIHEDGKYGSPLIALETIESINLRNEFEKYNCIFTEIDVERCEILKKNVSTKLKSMKKRNIVNEFCYAGNWGDYTKEIIEILKDSKWGFLFLDPFANQINIDLLIEILNTEYIYSLKDIMIFVNYNAFKRLIGTENENLLTKVASFFGIAYDELIEQINNVPTGNIDFKLFNELLISRLQRTNKKFICGTSIPNTKNGKLTKSDYFFLIFCTTDVNMVDEFYKKYNLIMREYKHETTFINELQNRIMDSLSKGPITLLSLYKNLTSTFISWKSNYPTDIPTKNQIIDFLNEQSKRGNVKFDVKNSGVFNKKIKDHVKLRKGLNRSEMEGIEITNE